MTVAPLDAAGAPMSLGGLVAGTPDGIIADLLAEAGGGDAETIRRGLALGRARALLVRLAAHDGTCRCEKCGGPLRMTNDALHESGLRRWCSGCGGKYRRPGMTLSELAALLAGALAEAGDVRTRGLDNLLPADVLYVLLTPACPECGSCYLSHWSKDSSPGVRPTCKADGCGWSGPASALLPPLLSREALDAAVAALRRPHNSPNSP